MTINDKLNLLIRLQLCNMGTAAVCEGCPFEGQNCGDRLIAAAKQAIQEDAINDENILEDTIVKILLELGATQGSTGWRLAVEAIKLVAEDPQMLIGVTKGLYPTVAETCGIDTRNVERIISRMIDRAWDRGDYQTAEKYFGNSIHPNKGRPTVKEFIARIADAANREIAHQRG